MKIYYSQELENQEPGTGEVHSDGFYFFNLDTYRTLALVIFDEQEAEIIWVNDHPAYERVFQNSKDVIEKWLRSKGLID
jgi:mRNA interferase HigB